MISKCEPIRRCDYEFALHLWRNLRWAFIAEWIIYCLSCFLILIVNTSNDNFLNAHIEHFVLGYTSEIQNLNYKKNYNYICKRRGFKCVALSQRYLDTQYPDNSLLDLYSQHFTHIALNKLNYKHVKLQTSVYNQWETATSHIWGHNTSWLSRLWPFPRIDRWNYVLEDQQHQSDLNGRAPLIKPFTTPIQQLAPQT